MARRKKKKQLTKTTPKAEYANQYREEILKSICPKTNNQKTKHQ